MGSRSERYPPDPFLHVSPSVIEQDTSLGEHRGRHTVASDQLQKDVLRPDEVVLQQAGLFLSEHEHPPGLVREALKHSSSPC